MLKLNFRNKAFVARSSTLTTEAQIIKAKLKAPIYIWSGFVLLSIYYTWQAYAITGTGFQIEVPQFDGSQPLLLPLTLCALLDAVLAWFIPWYMLRLSRPRDASLALRFVAFVIRLALIGSICLYGLILATQSHNGNLILPFSIFTFLGYIRSIPTPKGFGFFSN